ncbi:MAG: hypothetical protein QXU87_01195 [Candidatus Caldarchaeum sp.]
MKKQKEEIDEKKLREAVKQALKQPRLAFYSPLAAAILNYRKNVIPRYSISDELAKIVESALRQKYPRLTSKARFAFSKARREISSRQRGKAFQ